MAKLETRLAAASAMGGATEQEELGVQSPDAACFRDFRKVLNIKILI